MSGDLTRHGRYSRSVYGPIADVAEDALLNITDNGHGRPIDDELRWVVFTAVHVAMKATP